MSPSLSPKQRKTLLHCYLEMIWNPQQFEESGCSRSGTLLNESQQERVVSLSFSEIVDLSLCVSLAMQRQTASFTQLCRTIRRALPDLRLTIVALLAEEETVIARWSIEGIDLGGYEASLPTGRAVHLTGMTVVRLDGRMIVDEWHEMDVMGLLRQFGLTSFSPSPRITIRHPRPASLPLSTPLRMPIEYDMKSKQEK